MKENAALKEFFTRFAEGTLGRKKVHGNWLVVDNCFLRYKAGTRSEETLAIRQSSGVVLLNSSQLQCIGEYMVWGYPKSAQGETWHQRFFRESIRCIPIPFIAFREAGIDEDDLYHATVLEWNGDEEVLVIVPDDRDHFWIPEFGRYSRTGDKIPRHYTGAALIEVPKGRDTDNPDGTPVKFLFDVDRQELLHGYFNPFVAQLPDGCAAKTVAEAYDALIPQEVKDYMDRTHEEPKRQGELFFIPEEPPPAPEFDEDTMRAAMYEPSYRAGWLFEQDEFQKAEEKHERCFNLVREAMDNTKMINSHCFNHAVIRDGKTYAYGVVEHTRREHQSIYLDEWHRVIPNAAVRNFQVTGKID